LAVLSRPAIIGVLLAGALAFSAVAQDESVAPGNEGARGEATSEPTVTAQPTATSRPGPGAVLLEENFDDPARAILLLTSNNPSTRSMGYVDGEYEIQSGLTMPGVVGSPLPETGADTSIAIDGRVYGGPDTRGVYVLSRWSQAEGVVAAYRFGVLPAQGRFTLERQDGSRVVSLVSQPSSAIRGGEAMNRLELTCVGPSISASINGTPVAAIQDPSYPNGRHFIGVNGAGSSGRFDNLVVTQR
jgi:hypothetical protein